MEFHGSCTVEDLLEEITLVACEMSVVFKHSLKSLFFGIAMKTTFPILWPLLSFPNLLVY